MLKLIPMIFALRIILHNGYCKYLQQIITEYIQCVKLNTSTIDHIWIYQFIFTGKFAAGIRRKGFVQKVYTSPIMVCKMLSTRRDADGVLRKGIYT